MRHVVVPCASNRPLASVMRPSAVPTRRPQLRTWPSASHKRNLELQRRTADAFFKHRLDGKAHAAIEERRREAAVHRAPWVEVCTCWINGDRDMTAFGLHHVITQSLCERVEGQHSAGKALDEL
jgi:hypothetical protein